MLHGGGGLNKFLYQQGWNPHSCLVAWSRLSWAMLSSAAALTVSPSFHPSYAEDLRYFTVHLDFAQ
jgi:hypothetical protein